MIVWTNCVIRTNNEPIVYLKEFCHACLYYRSFRPARPARDT